jgi:glucosamine kinase
MTLFAGIDGGQSSTVAVIGDEQGRTIARGSAGPADEVGQGAESTRLRDALRAAIQDALVQARLPLDSHFTSIVAGISGYDGKVYGQTPDIAADRITLVHDTVIAHAGALAGSAGVVVIAGTGSVAYAENERGDTALIGGWGYLFGDEGSAFWLARDAIADAMRDSDSGESNDLLPEILEYFSQPSLRALVRAFYTQTISRMQLASFAQELVRQAEAGNERASQYVRDGAASLVLLAKHAADRVGLTAANVAFTGGMMRSEIFNENVDRWLHEVLPQATRITPERDAAEGALLLAYRPA